MKILLTGASGALGYQTAQKLVAAGYDVIAMDLPGRKRRRRLRGLRGKAELVYGSVNDPALMEALVRRAEAVIHLAAVLPPQADRNPELARQVNEGGTAVLADAIRSHNPHCFLLYASSISVYGDRLAEPWIQVGDPLKISVGDHYAITKIHAEELICAAGIPFAIFRLTAVMGLPKTDPLMFHMPLATPLEIVSAWDTADALVAAMARREELEGRIFNLGGGPGCRTTYAAFLQRMFRIYGLRFHYLLEEAFAKKNFHCGWYLDTGVLNDILHFQQTDLEGYYAAVQKETRSLVRFFSKLFSRPILRALLRKSEPLQARKTHDIPLMERFFGKDSAD